MDNVYELSLARNCTHHACTAVLVRVLQTANVMEFGAKGDGVTDDTAAVQAALDAVSEGALYFPSGKYVLNKKLSIDKSVVVRCVQGHA